MAGVCRGVLAVEVDRDDLLAAQLEEQLQPIVGRAREHARLDHVVLQLLRLDRVDECVENLLQRDVRDEGAAEPVVDGPLRHPDPFSVRVARLQPVDTNPSGEDLAARLGGAVAEVPHEEPVRAPVLQLRRDAPLRRLDVAVPGRDRLGLQLRRGGGGDGSPQEGGRQRDPDPEKPAVKRRECGGILATGFQVRAGRLPRAPRRLQCVHHRVPILAFSVHCPSFPLSASGIRFPGQVPHPPFPGRRWISAGWPAWRPARSRAAGRDAFASHHVLSSAASPKNEAVARDERQQRARRDSHQVCDCVVNAQRVHVERRENEIARDREGRPSPG